LEVHHGKTFILLSLCLKEKELGIAVDIFDNQELNVDFSGKGDLELFRRNLLKHGNETQSKIIKKSSMSLKPDDKNNHCGSFTLTGVIGMELL
jgi:hypothetical protein